jgi:hypothetical protein
MAYRWPEGSGDRELGEELICKTRNLRDRLIVKVQVPMRRKGSDS